MAKMTDPNMYPTDAFTLGLMTSAIVTLGERYRDEVPAAEKSKWHQAQWIAEQLHNELLPNLGYFQVSPPSPDGATPAIVPNEEFGIGAPGITPTVPIAGDREHGELLVTRSTEGTIVQRRYVGPWRNIEDMAPNTA